MTCDRLHVLPEQVMRHDYLALLQMWEMFGMIDEARKPKENGRQD